MTRFIIGLTGGVGSGKSEASKILGSFGACIVDADTIARDAVNDPEIKQKLMSAWPSVFSNNQLDRKALGRIVFSNKDEREKLNRIVHPWIVLHCIEAIKRCKSKIAVLVAPLLIENGLQSMVNEVWVVDAPEEIRLKRIVEREKIAKEEALLMLQSQLPSEKKREAADVVIENGETIEKLKESLRKKWHAIEKNES